MKVASAKTILEVISAISINLTSGWFGILFVFPKLDQISFEKYLRLLTPNLLFGIVGLIISLVLTERGKSL